MFRMLSMSLLTCLTSIPVFADMVIIPADQDVTLIEDAEGDVANGSGPYFFAGHTNQEDFGIRRGLIRFDVATAVPENALIDSATLKLYQTSNNETPSAVSVHRVMSDWGEGASFATGGSGAAAEVDDATWLHTFYDYEYWVQQGGHVIPHASAIEMVSGNGFYTWEDSVHLVNNVRLWLHAPQQNYGWLVMGDEATRGSVKRFYSRECTNDNIGDRHQCDDSSKRPMLTIEYHMPGE